MHRVTDVRNQELKYLHKELMVWAVTLVLMVMSPVVATAATFAVYVLMNEDNILTASMTFSVLLLFSALRFPINFGGRLMGSTYTPAHVRILYSLSLIGVLNSWYFSSILTFCLILLLF